MENVDRTREKLRVVQIGREWVEQGGEKERDRDNGREREREKVRG